MNIDLINKKRKQINILSLTITILIFIVFLVVEIMFAKLFWWIGLIGLAFLIISLYLLSKFIVKPLYNKLVLDLFKLTFSNRYKNYNISLNKSIQFIYYLFNKDYLNQDNCIKLENDKYQISFSDIVYENKSKRSPINHFYGKAIEMSLKDKTLQEEAFISQNKGLSDKFIELLTPKYKNSNNNISSLKKFKPYICFYNDEYDSNIINSFEMLNDFIYINIKDNKINVFYIYKEDGFNFKLTNPIENDVQVYIKEKYNDMFKIIDNILMEVK